ncbi:DUF6082 family protein [Streptomyces sp. NPDC050528]|uniref:DUF6082 family protein n=1 Tax=Streptomyces sp. NPDC050528 TaxID=3365623 RepID=UPI0037B28A3C
MGRCAQPRAGLPCRPRGRRPTFGCLTRGFALATENSDARRNDSADGSGASGLEQLARDLLLQVASLTEELRKANLIQLHRIMAEQTGRAMTDSALAEALSTLQGLSEVKRRQVLFVNAQYSAIVLNHRLGAIDWDELIGHMRVWCINRIFQEYWEMTDEHRKSLPQGSLEARVGKAVDAIMADLADDPDEWWVVGPDAEPS